MLNFSSHLQWFQAKIGSYDKQIWETSVEQRILQGLENRPKREGSLNKELIDIDLVRGSTFSKAKPRHGLKSVIFNGLKKVIFFPYYINHWHDHLNKEVVYFFFLHYVVQIIQLILYVIWGNSSEIMLEEIFLPIILALSLGVLHAHIIDPYTVKQRRKKTVSSSINISPISKQQTGQTVLLSQLSDLSQQGHQDTTKADTVNKSQENSFSARSKKKSVLFRKSTSPLKVFNDDDKRSINDQTVVQTEGYDGETESDDILVKNSGEEKVNETNNIDNKDFILSNSLTNVIPKYMSKQINVSDHLERSASYAKPIINSRRCSQPDIITVADEEHLKKFISSKKKQIPDPTPIIGVKKEKEKTTRKSSFSGKNFKLLKTRRQTVDCVTNNSENNYELISSCNVLCTCAPITPGSPKNNKSVILEPVTSLPCDDTSEDASVIEKLKFPGKLIDEPICDMKGSGERKYISNNYKSPTMNFIPDPVILKNCHSVSQPHTPICHSDNKVGNGFEVRKVSSACVSPSPSRKDGSPFIVSSRDLLSMSKKNPLNSLTTNIDVLNGNHDHACLFDLIRKPGVCLDNGLSSEDCSVKAVDLNEDTITKAHKKREEFEQLFLKKAQLSFVEKVATYEPIGTNMSSSSSSRNATPEAKHIKSKRRNREDRLTVGESLTKMKNRKEMVQSMSETEYDRMNSDVNSTGNSSSDGEEICHKIISPKTKAGGKEGSELVVDAYEELTDIGSNSSYNAKNENVVSPEEVNQQLQSGDIINADIIQDDPFVLWYKEAHAPGSLHGMTGSVSCYIWENDELKKTNLSLLDIGWSIIQAVERHEQEIIYSSFGFFIIIILCFTPIFFRMYVNRNHLSALAEMTCRTTVAGIFHSDDTFINSLFAKTDIETSIAVQQGSGTNDSQWPKIYSWTEDIIPLMLTSLLASEWPIRLMIIFGIILRLTLYTMTFLMLCVAENSFEQRLQYAKHFCRLTSSRRARKYYLPHFRLNKLANIKCWLSLRSYLKKRGPQRSVESIISSAFYMLLAMLSLACVNLIQSTENLFVNRLINWDLMLCSLALGIFMMRFLVLGTKITKKYRNLSVILTEQINLFLAMQTRPHKKEELTLAHNVLRLAESLLKEVEGPFRICGWSMNPFLYNILKVVILSVFSTVLSETCGFKMKLYKIKLNPANW